MLASDETRFEVAGALHAIRLRSLERTLENSASCRRSSWTRTSLAISAGRRDGSGGAADPAGKLLGRRSFRFAEQEFPDHESISAFVGLY